MKNIIKYRYSIGFPVNLLTKVAERSVFRDNNDIISGLDTGAYLYFNDSGGQSIRLLQLLQLFY